MEKYPLKEIKKLQNEVIRKHKILSFDNFKISNVSQLEIIKLILDSESNNEVLYQKDLENLLNIRKSTISGILETMEKNKIINRVSNPKGKILRLSLEAEEVKDKVFNHLRMVEDNLIRGIDEKDLDVFYRVIDKMRENLRKEEN